MQKVQYLRSGLPDEVLAHGGWTRTSYELDEAGIGELHKVFDPQYRQAEQATQANGATLAPMEIVELTDEQHTLYMGKPCHAYGWRALVETETTVTVTRAQHGRMNADGSWTVEDYG